MATSAVGAALAWWFARDVLDHPQPFFAPVTVLVTLGLSYGQRLRRVLELVVGVAVGVGIGDLFVAIFGTGVWQISLVAFVAMSITTFLGAGPLLSVQAGVQGVIVTTLVAAPDQAFSRWVDALVGGVIAIVLATLAPAAPVRRPRRAAAEFVDEIGEIMREIGEALRSRDEVAATRALRRARDTEERLSTLRTTADEGLEVAAISPLHHRRRQEVRAIADLITPLDRCVRNLRVVARRAGVAIRADETVPDSYIDLLSRLADVVTAMSERIDEQQVPDFAREGLTEIADDSRAGEPGASLSAELMRAQIRSMCVDLLMLTGRTHDEASTDLIPKVDPAPRSPDQP
nr:FUSC family protein [Janibacter alkaliphilus]